MYDAFMSFYKENASRLAAKIAEKNAALRAEAVPVIRPIFADMADLNEGGKLLRGVLVNLGCRIAGVEDVSVSDGAALAFEIFQTGVLIHDDIIDRALSRRGKPTIQVRYAASLAERGLTPPTDGDTRERIAESAALCAGDFMIYDANLYLAETYGERAGEIIAAFDRIMLDTVRGELLDTILPVEFSGSADKAQNDKDLMAAIYRIYHLKTSLYSVLGPLDMGLLIGGASGEDRAAFAEMADELGIAFQIKDDLLGIYADEKELGKDVGSDISEFKQTILYAYLRLNDPAAYEELLTYYGKASISREDLAAVQELFERSGARAYAEEAQEECFRKAEEKLADLDFVSEENKAIIRDFIAYSRDRRK